MLSLNPFYAEEVGMVEAAKTTVPECCGGLAASATAGFVSVFSGLSGQAQESSFRNVTSARSSSLSPVPSSVIAASATTISDVEAQERARAINSIVGDERQFRSFQRRMRTSLVITDGAAREVIENLIFEQVERQRLLREQWVARAMEENWRRELKREAHAKPAPTTVPKKDFWMVCKSGLSGIVAAVQDQDDVDLWDDATNMDTTGWNKKASAVRVLEKQLSMNIHRQLTQEVYEMQELSSLHEESKKIPKPTIKPTQPNMKVARGA
mmetsp:Transcript_22807/g.46299  ORF Transcript_22807/g.46299 Transcript_22807/m.46299 type:complete len:268 (-) Transcript_22807:146-949(-)